MLIKTKEFQFPKSLYFMILFKSSLTKSWWIVALLASMAVYQGVKGFSKSLLLLGGLAMVFPSYLVIRCWVHASSKKNRLFFKERSFEIDYQFLISRFPDGTENKIKLDTIIGVRKKKKAYHLFISKRQFIYLPYSAFYSDKDINYFESILRTRK
jgi:hypothetical protein